MGASAPKIIDSTIRLMVFSLKEIHSSREGLSIASNVLLRNFTGATNHGPPHRRTPSIFAFSCFTLHPDLSYLITFYIHPVDAIGPENFLSIIC